MSGSQDNLLALEKKRSWIYDPGLRHLYLLLCIPLATSYSVGYDGSVLNGLQSSPYWQNYFHEPKGGILGLFNAMQSIGNLCALPFAPFVVDWIGRRYTIFGGSLVMCIGVGIMTSAQNFEYFIWGRWLIGFGLAFCTMAGPLLVTELAYHKQRVTLTSIYHWAYDIGSLFAAWITFGTTNSGTLTNTWAWRIPCLIQALSAVVQVVGILFVPESPRWLIKKGRIDEAVEIMAKYHANGDRDDPYVKFETEQIHLSLEEEKITKEYRWKDLYSTPGNRKRTNTVILIGLFSQWSGNSLISYYLTGILNTVGITKAFDQQLVNGCKTIWSFGITLFAALIVHKFRRRTVFLFSSGGMLFAFTIWTILSALYSEGYPTSVGYGVIVMIFSHSGFYAPSWLALLYTYTLEISTINMRAKIQMVLGLSSLAALIVSQYVNPIALAAIGWKFYLVYEVILVFEVTIIYFYFVEPRGRTLEEAATTFADANAADAIFHVRDEVAEKSVTRHVEERVEI